MNARAFVPLLTLTLAAQISVTTRLVEVNVIVRSKNAPVRDLTKDDFRLFEKGKERKIALFTVNAAHPEPPGPLQGTPPTTTAPGVFANRPLGVKPPVNVTVVLLDGLNTDIKDQNYARAQALRFLRQIRPEDRVAVYALGSTLRVLNDFTSDSTRLAATVARFKGDNIGLASAAEAAPADTPDGFGDDKIIEDAILNQANDMISDYTIQLRAEKTAAALEAIAAHIGAIPGRKNLIWITSGFPFLIGHMGDGQANSEDTAFDDDISGVTASKKGGGAASGSLARVNDRDGNPARNQKSFTAESLRATRALNDANIAVYPVDARGLVGMPKSMSVEGNFGVSHAQAMAPSKGTSTILTGITAMRTIAESTGGIVFQNGNDLAKAIRTAVDDSEVTYTLGFYPDSSSFDSTFHELKVQVKRKDVEVRYRKGYMALPEAPAATQSSALASPLMATGIGLTAAREPAGKPGSISLVVAIEPKDISFEQSGSVWNAALDLVFAQRTAEGKDLVVANTPLGLKLDRSRYDAVFTQGLTITKAIDLAPGATELRVLVRDRASGRTGTLILPATLR